MNILADLFSQSDSKRNEAIKKSSNINEFESLEILKSLFATIETASEIETNLFKSFIEWATTKEQLYTDALSKLSSLPAERIKISFIPSVFEFGRICLRDAEIKKLTDKWGKENSKLLTAIKQK